MDGGYGYPVQGPHYVERSGCPFICINELDPGTEYTITVVAVLYNDIGGYDVLTASNHLYVETCE